MTSVKITPIGGKGDIFNPERYKRAIENAGNMTAKAVEVDFHVTTRTWKHQPAFKIEHTAGRFIWIIATNDKIYSFVSGGTKAHIIRPKRAGGRLGFYRTGFRAKSRVGYIGSNAGASASRDLTVAKIVHHPGTQARNFAKAIKTKWDAEWSRQLQRAIRAAAMGGK